MLAYVFSHRAGPHTAAAAYEGMLREFHLSLAAAGLPGFLRSLTYRTGSGYSDWYLVESSAALDGLNEAAVTGRRAASHDAAARMAVDGVGKLLSLAAGELDVDARVETGFSKPPGMSYTELYATLERWTSLPGSSLWRRMMVLGPPPEFCLVTAAPVELPPPMRPETASRTPI